MPNHPIAVQMYSLRDNVAANYVGTLRAVAELGYGAVELVTLGDFKAAALRTELDTLGLQVAGMHVALDRLEHDLDAAIADVLTLGARKVVCPWLPPERRGSADIYHSLAKTLNQVGRTCQTKGLQLCYHHHDFEFQRFGDTTALAIIFGETDPALVQAELDVYWAAYAGVDPVGLLRSMAGRVPLVHLKDMSADASRTFAEVGHGVLDFPAILAACDDAGVEWFIVEQDQSTRPPLESVGMSLAYLRSGGRA
jgi:sugar phosphate isomerase/epimerase